MIEAGSVSAEIKDGIATVTFGHPKSNSLPGTLLRSIAAVIDDLGVNPEAAVIVLQSKGEKVFCGGASFDELLSLRDSVAGKHFFMGFATLILAMKKCPKFIIARIQGKAIGGGVGVAAAADYALAHGSASVKLSELALGLGPFVVGPAVERKLGTSAFSILSIDNKWRDAAWACSRGLYADVYESQEELDAAVHALAQQLTLTNPRAMKELKAVLWEGTEHWDELLERRAEHSGSLALSDYTSAAIAAFGKKLAG